MIRLRVKDILKERDISVYEFNKQIDISENALRDMVNNKTKSIRFENIEALCNALDCTPNDLFVITED